MHVWTALLIGAVLGALNGSWMFFVPQEPHKPQVFAAVTIRNALVALLAGYALTAGSRWWTGLGYGALYGWLTALVVYLARGGWRIKYNLPIVIFGTLLGAITGVMVWWLALARG